MIDADVVYGILLKAVVERNKPEEVFEMYSESCSGCIYLTDAIGNVTCGTKTPKFHEYLINRPINSIKDSLRVNEFVHVPANKIDEYEYVIQPLNADDLSAGIIIIEYSQESTEKMAEILSIVTGFVRLGSSSGERIPTSNSLEYLISRELLTSESGIAEELLLGARSSYPDFKPGFRIVCFTLPDSFIRFARYPAAIFRQTHQTAFSLRVGSKIYSFLYRESSENDRVNELRDELDLFCKENNVKCVVSSLFTSLSQRGVFIEQTDILSPLCLKIAPNDRVFFADDYFCEYVCAIVGQQIDPEYLNLTAIEYLAKQDAREGTEYLRTLNCYLDCRNNASLAAKKLFIDRTTLKYRLKKIDQLMHVNIESPATAIALKYGILIRDILLANSNAAESGGSRSNSGRVRQTPVFWEAGATK